MQSAKALAVENSRLKIKMVLNGDVMVLSFLRNEPTYSWE
jgi:hypothetical protein